jgi:peptidoglycan/LPS O-acetylase OafA/YrhL
MSIRAYRPDIDALRAIAVLAVLGFHAFPNFVRGGFVGVDVFFVISGYLIAGILQDGLNDPEFRLRDFYARRVRRIFPSLILVMSCCLGAGWYMMLPSEFMQIGKHVVAGAAFVSNLVLWQESGYFDTAADAKPLLHLWSLGIEEQFYAVMPIAMLVGSRFFSRSRLATASFIAVLFALCVWLTRQDATAAFYAPWSRVWELLAGGWLATGSRQGAPAVEGRPANAGTRGLARDLGSLIGIAALAVAILAFDKTLAFPGAWALLPVVGAMLLIACGPGALVNRSLLRLSPLIWIGLISYPLYLWHWPLLRMYLMGRGELLTPMNRIGLLAAAFFAAWLTYAWVEKPLRRRPADLKHIGILAVAMTAVAVAGALAWFAFISPRNTTIGLDKILAATYDWRFPTPSLRPVLFRGNRFFEQRTSNDRVVVFIGDSNIEQLAPRVSALLTSDPIKYPSAVFATKGGCLPIPDWNPVDARCADRLNVAIAYAERPEVDAVVLGGSWINVLGDKDPIATVAPLGPLIRRLASGRKVFLVLNIPAGPQFDPHSMFVGSRMTHLAANAHPSALSKSAFLRSYGPLRDEIARIGRSNGAVIIDPLDSLCTGDACPVVDDDGRPLYLDEHHMRPFHAERDAKFIDETLGASPRDSGKR